MTDYAVLLFFIVVTTCVTYMLLAIFSFIRGLFSIRTQAITSGQQNDSFFQKTDQIFPAGFGFIVTIFAFLIAFAAFPFNSFLYSGVALTGLIGIIFAASIRRSHSLFDWALIGFLFVSSFSFFFRSDPLILFFQFVVYVYAFSLLLLPLAAGCSLLQLLMAPVTLLTSVFKSGYTFWPSFSLPSFRQLLAITSRFSFVKSVLTVIFICVILLMIVPMLTTIDPRFAQWIESIFYWPLHILDFIFSWNLMEFVFRSIIFAMSWLFLARIPAVQNLHFPTQNSLNIPFYMSLVQAAVAAVVGVFLLSQAGLYVASIEALQSTFDFNLSMRVNEVFFQLSYVVFVLFTVVTLDAKKDRIHRIFSGILLVESFFMILAAISSNWMYVAEMGLTQARMYGFLTVILLLALGIILAIRRLTSLFSMQQFVRASFFVFACIAIIPTILPFDWVVYQYNQSRGIEVVEYAEYFELDSFVFHNIRNGYKPVRQQNLTVSSAWECDNPRVCTAAARVESQFQYLKNKYPQIYPLAFNLAEFIAYSSTK